MTTASEHQSETWLCLGLAFIGGYADAASYILAGTFTGHLTGNSVLVAISLAEGDWLLTSSRLLAIGTFSVGILLSSVVGWIVKRQRARAALTVALLIEAILVGMAALSLGLNSQHTATREGFIVFMCLAMGLQNGALRKANGITVHTTFMTGTVTQLLEHEFDQFQSESKRHSTASPTRPTDPTFRLLSAVWTTFILGAVAGAYMGLYCKSFTVIGVAGLLLLLALCKLQVSKRVPHQR